ncbi:MAG: hypothetical protein MH186_03205 [Marinobacter sp.]|nr:hypothetical protein [Marinobacter sp.]
MATFRAAALGSGRPIRGMAVLSVAAISFVFDPWFSQLCVCFVRIWTAGLLLFAELLSIFWSVDSGRCCPRNRRALAAQSCPSAVLLLLQPFK